MYWDYDPVTAMLREKNDGLLPSVYEGSLVYYRSEQLDSLCSDCADMFPAHAVEAIILEDETDAPRECDACGEQLWTEVTR